MASYYAELIHLRAAEEDHVQKVVPLIVQVHDPKDAVATITQTSEDYRLLILAPLSDALEQQIASISSQDVAADPPQILSGTIAEIGMKAQEYAFALKGRYEAILSQSQEHRLFDAGARMLYADCQVGDDGKFLEMWRGDLLEYLACVIAERITLELNKYENSTAGEYEGVEFIHD